MTAPTYDQLTREVRDLNDLVVEVRKENESLREQLRCLAATASVIAEMATVEP
jgi:uncharacterized coiled-coil protein SlyX